MALRIYKRGLFASSYRKVIPRTSIREVAYGATLLLWLLVAARAGEKKYNKMKKLKVLVMMLCIAAMGFATSCSKEDEDLIVGEWKPTHYVWSYYIHGPDDYHTQTVTYGDDGFGMRIKFTNDGIAEGYDINNERPPVSVNYVVRDGYLIFDRAFMFWEKKYKIEKLTKKELILSYLEDSDSPRYEENTIKVHAEFKRI